MLEAYLSSRDAAHAQSPENTFDILPHPTSFYTVTNHISLYILALRGGHTFCTAVFDQVRRYYAENSFTTSAFRLDYVYTHTDSSCALRDFLIESAVSRIQAHRASGPSIHLTAPSSQELAPAPSTTASIAAATPSPRQPAATTSRKPASRQADGLHLAEPPHPPLRPRTHTTITTTNAPAKGRLDASTIPLTHPAPPSTAPTTSASDHLASAASAASTADARIDVRWASCGSGSRAAR